MQLINTTTGKIITKKLKIASSFWDRLLGLLNPRNPRTLLFQTRFGIHTFFLSSPIDVVVLDNRNKVVMVKTNLLPYRFFFYNPIYKFVIELPVGSCQNQSISIGDTLDFVCI